MRPGRQKLDPMGPKLVIAWGIGPLRAPGLSGPGTLITRQDDAKMMLAGDLAFTMGVCTEVAGELAEAAAQAIAAFIRATVARGAGGAAGASAVCTGQRVPAGRPLIASSPVPAAPSVPALCQIGA
jgi:hypothetical protein